MSTSTNHAWLILVPVRLTSRKRAPLRSAPQNTAPARSPSNSSGMSLSLLSLVGPARADDSASDESQAGRRWHREVEECETRRRPVGGLWPAASQRRGKVLDDRCAARDDGDLRSRALAAMDPA